MEQSLHIQELNALQRKQSASSVEKTDIMALFASPKAKEGVNELQTQPIDAPLNEDSTAEDYAPVYFTATVNHLKMVIVKTLNCPLPQPHIHPLWLSKELSSQISRSPVKSIQLQAATFYLCTKQQLLLERISSWDN